MNHQETELLVKTWKDIHKYENVSDEQIIALIRAGDTFACDFLINKYRSLVKAKARSYFLIGSDKDDIIQEGMIGLFKAIRDFQSDKLSSFRSFADLCITRQIITAIKTASRQKHIPLNSYVSLNKPIFDNASEQTSFDLLTSSKLSNPEDLFISKEELKNIKARMNEVLSEFECNVLILYLNGKSYMEISAITEKSHKSIDNALQRVKRKIAKLVDVQSCACR